MLVTVSVGSRWMFTRRQTIARPLPCVENLKKIEFCKIEWQGNQVNEDTNHVPTWDDLRPYFPAGWSNRIPVCPSGGTYTIGRLEEHPKCSIRGYEHSWH